MPTKWTGFHAQPHLMDNSHVLILWFWTWQPSIFKENDLHISECPSKSDWRLPSENMKCIQVICGIMIGRSSSSLDVVRTLQIATQPEGSCFLTINAEWVRDIYWQHSSRSNCNSLCTYPTLADCFFIPSTEWHERASRRLPLYLDSLDLLSCESALNFCCCGNKENSGVPIQNSQKLPMKI